MCRAYIGTGRSPTEVDYVELHATGNTLIVFICFLNIHPIGTGTAAGDPVEANWVGEKFKRDDEILIGSVKGNIGYI